MTVIKHDEILHTWKKLKPNKKIKTRITENKEKKSSKLETKNYEDFIKL